VKRAEAKSAFGNDQDPTQLLTEHCFICEDIHACGKDMGFSM